MTKTQLFELITDLKNINNIQKTDVYVEELSNGYWYIITHLLRSIFKSDKKVDLIEEYIFDQTRMSFDQLCNTIGLKR